MVEHSPQILKSDEKATIQPRTVSFIQHEMPAVHQIPPPLQYHPKDHTLRVHKLKTEHSGTVMEIAPKTGI